MHLHCEFILVFLEQINIGKCYAIKVLASSFSRKKKSTLKIFEHWAYLVCYIRIHIEVSLEKKNTKEWRTGGYRSDPYFSRIWFLRRVHLMAPHLYFQFELLLGIHLFESVAIQYPANKLAPSVLWILIEIMNCWKQIVVVFTPG